MVATYGLITRTSCSDVTDNKNKTPIDVAAENANHTNPRWKKYIDIIDYLKCLQNMNSEYSPNHIYFILIPCKLGLMQKNGVL